MGAGALRRRARHRLPGRSVRRHNKSCAVTRSCFLKSPIRHRSRVQTRTVLSGFLPTRLSIVTCLETRLDHTRHAPLRLGTSRPHSPLGHTKKRLLSKKTKNKTPRGERRAGHSAAARGRRVSRRVSRIFQPARTGPFQRDGAQGGVAPRKSLDLFLKKNFEPCACLREPHPSSLSRFFAFLNLKSSIFSFYAFHGVESRTIGECGMRTSASNGSISHFMMRGLDSAIEVKGRGDFSRVSCGKPPRLNSGSFLTTARIQLCEKRGSRSLSVENESCRRGAGWNGGRDPACLLAKSLRGYP